ncbi:MAG: polysaccharide deacetylase family protein [Gammaproteobacteria bacterium]|nr:polysaccharide deacetylase family protein [Gammaproteobacteria bacterium]MDH5799227.1 polysaccharide deacetylase family protein [Gammaproteobacteria bacterium]
MLHTFKQLIKRLICALLYYSGLLFLFKKWVMRGKAVVLMYHRVIPETPGLKTYSHKGIIVDEKSFEKQLDFLKRHFQVLSAPEFVKSLHRKIPFEKPSCLISFDDGWIDNHDHAYTQLKKRNIPAIIFLPTDYMGTGKLFWQERLCNTMHILCKDLAQHAQLLGRMGFEMKSNDPDHEILKFVSQQKNQSPETIETLLCDLEQYMHDQNIKFPLENMDSYLNWDQVRAMDSNIIYYGSHAQSHTMLPKLSRDRQRNELSHSKTIIETETGLSIDSIAFPNGDYNQDTLSLCEECNYKVAFTTQRGHVSANDNPFMLKRVNVNNAVSASIPIFFCRVLGLL